MTTSACSVRSHHHARMTPGAAWSSILSTGLQRHVQQQQVAAQLGAAQDEQLAGQKAKQRLARLYYCICVAASTYRVLSTGGSHASAPGTGRPVLTATSHTACTCCCTSSITMCPMDPERTGAASSTCPMAPPACCLHISRPAALPVHTAHTLQGKLTHVPQASTLSPTA